jgi:hypothetical protein
LSVVGGGKVTTVAVAAADSDAGDMMLFFLL